MNEIAEKIKRRRLQILVHSFIYERLGENLISDYQWDMWAKELAELQDTYPEISEQVEEYKKDFKGWTGDTASGLIFYPEIQSKAWHLLRIGERKN